MRFFNSIHRNMSFADVVACIKYFIKVNPDCRFTLAVGTDSQSAGRFTYFATGIHIRRVGRGGWCCINKRRINMVYADLREKIQNETLITYDVINVLQDSLYEIFRDFSLKYKNFECRLEAHIDAGTKGESRLIVREMTGYFDSTDVDAKIKPDSYVASSYADRCIKGIKTG